MTALLDLAAQVEGLTKTCTETDMAIFAAIRGWSLPLVGAAYVEWTEKGRPSYTGSMDVVHRVIDAELPGSSHGYDLVPTAPVHGYICVHTDDDRWHYADAKTPVLALLAASLKGLHTKRSHEAHELQGTAKS
ncbi:MAG: hypothetical protein K2X45_07960 [Phreatobacter sp.]|nr:hypothetical protein [Phreatobacter sp.]